MGKKQILGLIGSMLLAVGVFAPFLNVTGFGNINYLNREIDATIVLVLAAISFILILTKKYKWLWFTGVGSLLTLIFTFIYFEVRLHEVKSQMQTTFAGTPSDGLGPANIAAQSVQPQWGCAILIIGVVLIIVSAAIKE